MWSKKLTNSYRVCTTKRNKSEEVNNLWYKKGNDKKMRILISNCSIQSSRTYKKKITFEDWKKTMTRKSTCYEENDNNNSKATRHITT